MSYLRPATVMALFFLVFTGFLFPFAVTAIANAGFPRQAEGSLIRDPKRGVIGSELVGQNFTTPRYFHPRPSAADYNAASSSGSNLGPTNKKLLQQVQERAATYRKENGLEPTADVPVDAVTASASGLDPHISVANATLQAQRVALARGLPQAEIERRIREFTLEPLWGLFGESCVNVVQLNLALDKEG